MGLSIGIGGDSKGFVLSDGPHLPNSLLRFTDCFDFLLSPHFYSWAASQNVCTLMQFGRSAIPA